MKKLIVFCAAMLLMLFVRVSVTRAQTAKSDKVVVSGEIIDMNCYMSKGAHGADHKGCASTCIANGNPMGLLTKDGKVYVLTAPHDNMDPYNKLKTHASETVTITGQEYNRNGIKSLEVDEIKM